MKMSEKLCHNCCCSCICLVCASECAGPQGDLGWWLSGKIPPLSALLLWSQPAGVHLAADIIGIAYTDMWGITL